VTSIHDQYPDIDITVQDTSVQGNDALVSLVDAINSLDDDARIELIVLTRGGGAKKHLRVFNEIPLCRVIHETTTPIIVGVGHETDRTLAGAVADARVMTPTEVGKVVPQKASHNKKSNDSQLISTVHIPTQSINRLNESTTVYTALIDVRLRTNFDRCPTDLLLRMRRLNNKRNMNVRELKWSSHMSARFTDSVL